MAELRQPHPPVFIRDRSRCLLKVEGDRSHRKFGVSLPCIGETNRHTMPKRPVHMISRRETGGSKHHMKLIRAAASDLGFQSGDFILAIVALTFLQG